MLVTISLFIFGLWVLIKGAESTVKGATAIARFFNVSSWVIGILIVGIGTSIPELSINISSAIKGGEVGVGTILGSNIFNILFILGFSAIFAPLTLKEIWVRRDVVLNILAIVACGLLAFLPIFGEPFIGVTRTEGVVALILFAWWILKMLSTSDESGHEDETHDAEQVTFITAGFLIVVGLVGVFLGGHWVVTGAQAIASALGVSEAVISIVIIGVGTSFPELVISITALRRKMGGIAIGNIIGSNIFDFIGIIGITTLFGPIAAPFDILPDFLVALGASVLLLVAMYVGKRYTLERREGIIFVLAYVAYITWVLMRVTAG